MGGFWQDLRHAGRALGKSPGVHAVMILTLALGIGATTAIFSVVYGVLLRPLPYADPARLMAVFEITSKGRPSRLADPNFDDFREQNRSFQALAKYSAYPASVSGASQPTRSTIAHVSADFFRVFGIIPVLGRSFGPGDASQGAEPDRPRQRRVLEAASRLAAGPPRGASEDRRNGVLRHRRAAGRISLSRRRGPVAAGGSRGERTRAARRTTFRAVGRLRDGVTVAQAEPRHQRDRPAHPRRFQREGRLPTRRRRRAFRFSDSITGNSRTALLILLGAVGFLLLVACANVANLLLAQASVKQRELAIRSALGAARGRLVRQFLTESLLLSLAGRRPRRSRRALRRRGARLRSRRRTCRGWRASRSVFPSSRSRSCSPRPWPRASAPSPPFARRPATCGRASERAGAGRRGRRPASASAASSWRRRSRSRSSSSSERGCSDAA